MAVALPTAGLMGVEAQAHLVLIHAEDLQQLPKLALEPAATRAVFAAEGGRMGGPRRGQVKIVWVMTCKSTADLSHASMSRVVFCQEAGPTLQATLLLPQEARLPGMLGLERAGLLVHVLGQLRFGQQGC